MGFDTEGGGANRVEGGGIEAVVGGAEGGGAGDGGPVAVVGLVEKSPGLRGAAATAVGGVVPPVDVDGADGARLRSSP